MDARDILQLTRRDFLATAASGVGGLALASLFHADGLLASEPGTSASNPFALRAPHFAPKAKQCIFLYMEGGVSQVDLFDPKPKLKELNGKKMPESMTRNVRFAFLQKDSAVLMGSPH